MSDVLAALLLAQLEERQRIQGRRRAIWQRYRDGLADWASAMAVRLPVVPPHCDQSYHMFYLILPSPDDRQRFIAHLRRVDIHAVFHYLPLHLSPMGRSFGGREGQCPVTESISGQLVRLPFYTDLTTDDQDRVIERVREWQPTPVGAGA
jgi:dTDP-4-amino-4,6-dideoxygalactose transaminase